MTTGTPLRLGAAATDITPDYPVTMAGFGQTRPFDAVSHPITARVLVFEQNGERAILISADLLRWSDEQVGALRRRLQTALGVAPELILVHATHTHCAPQTARSRVPLQAAADDAYLANLEDRVVAAARRAAGRVVPVTVSLGHGECGFGINRRLPRDGRIAMAPNPDGPVDRTLTVASFRDGDDRLRALLVHFTCHPTTSAQNRISPDYPGTALDQLEAKLGSGVVAAFLQGCCGDIRPALVEDGRFVRGNQDDVDRLAGELESAVIAALGRTQVPLAAVPLAGRRRVVGLPYSRLPDMEQLRGLAERTDREGRWARYLLANTEWRCGHAQLDVSLLTIADGLSLLALNAEPVVDYGFAIREIGGSGVLPLGYSNGMLGYLPTARQLAEGGYEADDSTRAYGLPAPLAPSVEGVAVDAIRSVLSPG